MKLTIGKRLGFGFGGIAVLMTALVVYNLSQIRMLKNLQQEISVDASDAVLATDAEHCGPVIYQLIADAEISRHLDVAAKEWAASKDSTFAIYANLENCLVHPQQKGWLNQSKRAYDKMIGIYEGKMLPILEEGVAETTVVNAVDREIDAAIEEMSIPMSKIQSDLDQERVAGNARFKDIVEHVDFISCSGFSRSSPSPCWSSVRSSRR